MTSNPRTPGPLDADERHPETSSEGRTIPYLTGGACLPMLAAGVFLLVFLATIGALELLEEVR